MTITTPPETVSAKNDPMESPIAKFEPFSLRRMDSLSEGELAAVERLAFQHGESPDSYLAIEGDRHCFLLSDHTAAMSVIVSGRYLHVPGGLLGPHELRPQMISQLSDYAKRHRRLIACYSIREPEKTLFEQAGWEVSKFGEDTALELSDLNWTGKSFEWVRRQFNACQRAGLICREIVPQTLAPEDWSHIKEELFEIQREDLRDRIFDQELNMLVGKLQPDQLRRRRLFVAEPPGNRRLEAFVIANPMRSGKGWALEMFRKRQAAPRGTIPYLIKWVIDALKAEGVEDASLCILLWKDCHTFIGRKSSLLLRWGLVLAYHLGDFFYHTKGMAHFKSRFRPQLTNSYVCVTPQTSVFSILNFFHVVGAFTFNMKNVVRNFWKLLVRGKSHRD